MLIKTNLLDPMNLKTNVTNDANLVYFISIPIEVSETKPYGCGVKY